MDEHLEVAVRPFPNSGKLENVWKTCSFMLLQPLWGVQFCLGHNQGKMMIGQLKLCRMRLPYRQRQAERFLAAPRSQIGNAHGSHSISAMIRPPEARKTPTTRERLCWDDHARKSEREGTFQREYRLFSQMRCAPGCTDICCGGL